MKLQYPYLKDCTLSVLSFSGNPHSKSMYECVPLSFAHEKCNMFSLGTKTLRFVVVVVVVVGVVVSCCLPSSAFYVFPPLQ